MVRLRLLYFNKAYLKSYPIRKDRIWYYAQYRFLKVYITAEI